MKLEPVAAPSEKHVESLYEVALEKGDLDEPSEAFSELVRSLLPDADEGAAEELVRAAEKRYTR